MGILIKKVAKGENGVYVAEIDGVEYEFGTCNEAVAYAVSKQKENEKR